MPSAWGAWDVEGGDLTVMLTLAEEGGYRISLHPDSYYPPESKRDQEADRKAEEFFRANAKPIVERVSRVPANWPPRYSTGWGLGWPPPFPPPPRYEFPLMTTAKTNEQ
jgi:hypothetical protein